MPQAQRDVGVLGGVARRRFEVDHVEGQRLLAGPGDILEGDRLVAEPAFRQRVHAVPAGSGVDDIGEQHRVVEAGDLDAVAPHHQPVIFQVLTDDEDRIVFQQHF